MKKSHLFTLLLFSMRAGAQINEPTKNDEFQLARQFIEQNMSLFPKVTFIDSDSLLKYDLLKYPLYKYGEKALYNYYTNLIYLKLESINKKDTNYFNFFLVADKIIR